MEPRYYRRPEILDAIPLDRHCVIEASAGTGKTFTIEHLVIDVLLNSGMRLDQILAVTFTEKAAAELRARIRDTIEKTVRGDAGHDEPPGAKVPLDADKLKRLEDALFSFERAPIHTIHSFCHRMLTELAFQSGARFAVAVVDSRTVFHEAFRAELREHFASDEWMRQLLEKWLDDERRDADRLEALLFDAYRRRYLDSGASARNTAAAELLADFDTGQCERELRMAGAKKTILASLEAILAVIKHSGRDPWRLRLELEWEDLRKVAGFERGHNLSEHTLKFIHAAKSAQYAAGLEACITDAFLPPVAERLGRIKRERGVIDFDDMPGWLWSALDGPQGAGLAATLRERFRLGLVDEFQDTDELQWRIVRRIFVEGGDNRLIVIGDPKQAIYAFRDADVFTYLDAKLALIGEYEAEFVPLTRNFRSTPDMVDAINLFFAESPLPTFFAAGDIRYEHPVTCGRPQMSARQNGGTARPITIFSLPPGAKLPARRYRAMLARKIAATLKGLLNGEDTIEIEESQARPVSAKDIFVLTRTLMESREIAAHLRAAGVPYAFYKQDGLFQTREAGDVLDVLRAVAEPHRRSNRLKAWSTPFFGVKLRDLPGLEDVPASHPLMGRLLEWKAIAEQGRFEELFSAMLYRSGLAARELLLADSQRELTNYEHIFEILLERAFAETKDLADLVQMLARWVDALDLPPGENPNVQRLDSERAAVQIMTVHKAKGLEADVVVLFGGYARGPLREEVKVFHSNGERQVVVGAGARSAAKTEIDSEADAEDERLLYVALTRARAKLYLATFPNDATTVKLSGYYRHLDNRIKALSAGSGEYRKRFEQLNEIIPLRGKIEALAVDDSKAADAIGSWSPPELLLREEGDHRLARLRAEIIDRHPPLSIASYTSMQRRADLREEAEESIYKYDLDSNVAEAHISEDLAGGRAVGIFLHEVIERLDLDQLSKARDLSSWKAAPEIRALLETAARRHQVPHRDAWLERGAEIVFNTLRSPIALDGLLVPALAYCHGIREMEFTFPVPVRHHPLLGGKRDGDWKIERGLLVGFVDFVFRFGDRTYFADWKSDLLPSYDPATVAAHVADHYSIQAQIYTVGIVRLLRIRDKSEYESRFGGLVYVFVRGIEPGGDGRAGIYFHRPAWDEIVAYERNLIVPAESAGGKR